MPELTEEAKAEIATAVAIVRSDKQHSMLRDIHTRTTPKVEPPVDPKNPPVNPPVDPPPPSDPPVPVKKVGLYWGDRLPEVEEK
jgi:hypothetical protein